MCRILSWASSLAKKQKGDFSKNYKIKFLAMQAAVFLTSTLHAGVKTPKVISSKMVLQRGVPAPIRGSAEEGEEVTVEFAGQTKKATAGGGSDGETQSKLRSCQGHLVRSITTPIDE
jgi:hypothetical protein